MAPKFSNEAILEQLKHGVAHFELVSSPVLSISTSIYSPANPLVFLGDYSHRFFAKTTGPQLGRGSPVAITEDESYSVQEVPRDARCLFRALAKGMAANKGSPLSPEDETEDADDLRETVEDIICGEHEKQNPRYEAARKAIVEGGVNRKATVFSHWFFELDIRKVRTIDPLTNGVLSLLTRSKKRKNPNKGAHGEKKGPLGMNEKTGVVPSKLFKRYCESVAKDNHWGGEPEILVLSQVCKLPIIVYERKNKHPIGGGGSGFSFIEAYGTEFLGGKKPVRLLKSGNHYDLLV